MNVSERTITYQSYEAKTVSTNSALSSSLETAKHLKQNQLQSNLPEWAVMINIPSVGAHQLLRLYGAHRVNRLIQTVLSLRLGDADSTAALAIAGTPPPLRRSE